MSILIRLTLCSIVLLFAACQGPTLATRIDEGIQDFDSWPLDVQESVKKGRIEVGFTSEQVRMAWGEPDYITHSSDSEQWIWEKKSLPISIGVGVGTGGRRGGVGGAVGTTVGGKNNIKRSVWIRDGVVDSYTDK